MSSFWDGFGKQAMQDTRLGEDAAVAGTGLLPFGAVGHTAMREGRNGKRLGDFGARLAGGIGGSILGGALTGGHMGGAILGSTAGQVVADRMRTGDMYDHKGNLKKEVRK